LPPVVIRTYRFRKRCFAALALLALLSFPLSGFIGARAARQSVAALAWSVANKVIVVDPGHGGFDPGVVGKNGVQEKDITLAIGKRLAEYLRQSGATVLMTRETDIDLSEPGTIGLAAKKREDLKKRVTLANEHKADLFVSIHVNSYTSPGPRGAQTFVQPGFPGSRQAGQAIQSELAAWLKNTDRHTKEVDYYVTRNTSMPAVLVETGFISNEGESRLLQDPAYQSKLAWAIYAGIVKYFNQPVGNGKEDIVKVFKEQKPDFLAEP